MTARLRCLLPVLGLIALTGCAASPPRVTSYKPPVPAEGIVVVANGAGGNTEATRALAIALKRTGKPLDVRTFEWTHGQGRGVLDVTDVDHSQEQARRLASKIVQIRAAEPEKPVYLVGFSAGTHIALEATRHLGPGSVDRVILLAPAVSADYDLAPALRASSQGVDVFYSERDQFYLGLGTTVFGNADGSRGVPAAGRVGFDEPRLCPNDDPALAGKLRQHPWSREVEWTGNTGTHAGSLSQKYLQTFVLPLFSTPAHQIAVPSKD